MDLYLPAEFRELHAAAPDDWRDHPSSLCAREDGTDAASSLGAGRPDRNDPDPSWRVL